MPIKFLACKVLRSCVRLWARFRYPVSLPEDLSNALGLAFSNCMTFDEIISKLTHPSTTLIRLKKFMDREEAEEAFESAYKKDRFSKNSLFSYYFNEGWIEFILYFDDESRLRRIYFQHKMIEQDEGIELALCKEAIA